MREIISLQVGQCGNQIGYKFWENITQEHGIDTSTGQFYGNSDLQLQRANVYFNEIENNYSEHGTTNRYVPRALLIDLEPGVLDSIQSQSSALSHLFNPDSFISGMNGAGNNWAKGFYSEGSEYIGQIMDSVRKEAERCEAMQGFQIVHSLGGGTGSGLGSNILNILEQEYSNKILSNFSVYPASASSNVLGDGSSQLSDVVVEPYNTMFSLNCLVNTSHLSVNIDNSALNRICTQQLKLKQPSFADINYIIAQSMSMATSTMRFPGASNNSDLRKLCTNLIPFSRLHFISSALAPLIGRGEQKYDRLGEKEILDRLFSGQSFISDNNIKTGKILTGSVMMRGQDVSECELETQMKRLCDKNSSTFVEWIPNRLMSTVCRVNPSTTNAMTGGCLINSTSIISQMQKMANNFEKMFARRAYVHWYTQEGMDVQEFDETLNNIRDMISEYQQYQDSGSGEDDEAHMLYEKQSNTSSKTASKSHGLNTTRASSRAQVCDDVEMEDVEDFEEEMV